MTYEYRSCTVHHSDLYELNGLAEEGWAVVGAFSESIGSHPWPWVLLSRPKAETPHAGPKFVQAPVDWVPPYERSKP